MNIPGAAHDPAAYQEWISGFSARHETIVVSFDPNVTTVTETWMPDYKTPKPRGWYSQSISKRGKGA